MDTALLVNKLYEKGCKFLLTRNFQDTYRTQQVVHQHQRTAFEGRNREVILMAIQHEVLPDYTILVCSTYPHEREVEQLGFFPVKKDRANWIPIQYRNRKGKEHLNDRDGDYSHTTNLTYLPISEVHDYLKMAEKQEQIKLIYK